MVKANSLLYAVYVCLIVGILCSGLLYFSSLYDRLNQFYNRRENLYIQNQSAVNHALANIGNSQDYDYTDEDSGVSYSSTSKPYGLLQILTTSAFTPTDTVTSIHLIGPYDHDKTCVYLSNFSRPLSYYGHVRLIGDKKLPAEKIRRSFSGTKPSSLVSTGAFEVSDRLMPPLNPAFEAAFTKPLPAKRIPLEEIGHNGDSLYFNSFKEETLEIQTRRSFPANSAIKGNFILTARDTLFIPKSLSLENVILKAPVVVFDSGFHGSAQVFATRSITVGENASLDYPSLLCVYNRSEQKGEISVGSGTAIYGSVVIFGNPADDIEANTIAFQKNTWLTGDVYCTGELMLSGTVRGSVYTSGFFNTESASGSRNCITDATIDNPERPSYYVCFPLFTNKNKAYGIFRKVQ